MLMLKVISVNLILIAMLGGIIDLHDIAKLPYLIDHYNQHKSKASQFSIAEFFDLHYGEAAEEHDKEESEKHKGLPFKAPDNTSIHSTVFLTERQCPSVQLEATTVSYTNFYQPNSSTEYRETIFQPPREV